MCEGVCSPLFCVDPPQEAVMISTVCVCGFPLTQTRMSLIYEWLKIVQCVCTLEECKGGRALALKNLTENPS